MHSHPNELMKRFIQDLDCISLNIKHLHDAAIILTTDSHVKYDAATVFEKCGKQFGKEHNYKVRHHDHISGKYIGGWCSRCNFLEGENNSELRVVFHNLRGYDSHHIIRYALKYINEDGYKTQFYCGKSSEQFNYIKVGKYIFMDSYQNTSHHWIGWRSVNQVYHYVIIQHSPTIASEGCISI
jgi:hypothetical protein